MYTHTYIYTYTYTYSQTQISNCLLYISLRTSNRPVYHKVKNWALDLTLSSLLFWVFPILVNGHFILGILQTKNLVTILDSSHTPHLTHPDIILALNKIYSESNHLFPLPSVSNTISLYYSLPTSILALIRTLIASHLTQWSLSLERPTLSYMITYNQAWPLIPIALTYFLISLNILFAHYGHNDLFAVSCKHKASTNSRP